MAEGVRRIAVTGGPGGGKTSLWRELLARFPDRFVAVPEVATLMFAHVFPEVQSEAERRAVQRSIYRVQLDSEAVHGGRLSPGQWLLADRGSPDGGGYWPGGHDDFFRAMGSDHQRELARYEAVLFLETAAAHGLSIADGNPTRVEDAEAAVAIDRRLHAVWQPHARFVHLPPEPTLQARVEKGCAVVEAWLAASVD